MTGPGLEPASQAFFQSVCVCVCVCVRSKVCVCVCVFVPESQGGPLESINLSAETPLSWSWQTQGLQYPSLNTHI